MIYDDHMYSIVLAAIAAYREALGEPEEGIIAVLYCMKERVHNSAKWEGVDWPGVITAPMQFSSMTDPNDPQLRKFPKAGDAKFHRMLLLADQVIAGAIPNPAPGADSYWADWIRAPFWATDDNFIRKIGRHSFHRVLK